MALILLNWMYIFICSLGMGGLLNFILKTKQPLFFTLILGLFSEMVLLHFYAVFFSVNEIFYVFNLFLVGLGFYLSKTNIIAEIKIAGAEWKSWKKSLQILAILLTLLLLMQSATPPFIVDNETYYLQTIKWLNEFGFIKGLANLHIFFGQMSGWHVLQSGFNFGFGSGSLNDLNGFLMLIFTVFSINHLNRFFHSRITMDLFLGLIPVGNLFFFQFVSAPSPDLPIFLISQLLFFLFYRNFNYYQNEFKIIFLLTLFLILIKITVAPLLILPLVLLIRHKKWTSEWKFSFVFSILAISAYFLKNYLISGYLIYPTEFLSFIANPDWKVDPNIQKFFFHEISQHALNTKDLENSGKFTTWNYLKNWLFEPGLRSIFNKLIIVLLLVFPLYIRKNKTLFWLYIYALVQFGILFFTSPQYRFFMALITGMSLYILAKLLMNKSKLVLPILSVFSLSAFVPIFFSINVSKWKNSDFMPDYLAKFQWENTLKPASNSMHNFDYEKIKEGNLEYNSPVGQKDFFWIVGDGKLPAVNKEMLEYFKKWYKIRPQMRTENLKDGFYAEKLDE